MLCSATQSKTILQALAALLLFTAIGAAQIAGLCNTGQTAATSAGCTGVLVTPNPTGGGPNRDGNWALTYQPLNTHYHTPCHLKTFVGAWVDTPSFNWFSNSVSTVSEWATPYDGESNLPAGWYVYATSFPVPPVLPGGGVPTGVTINGQLASDNATFAIYLESPANSGRCSLVSGQPFPVNPAGSQSLGDFRQWWPFSFTNALAITPGANAYLYFVVQNAYDSQSGGPSPTGFRAEFFSTSTFN